MKITGEIIEHIAELARLRFDDAEKEKLASELGKILAYADKLNELDTTGVEPMKHVVSLCNVFREDEVKESMDRSMLLENASSQEDGYFKVPKAIE
ncbi:MAG: Asp-tRNA(Asn)/Glu-tRNA(Gln) amidotransferase subunit GatC [Bacillota bacterium]